MPSPLVAPVPVALPRVVLTKERVPLNVLRFIPLETVEKFQITAFESTEQVLKLALVHPEQLKQGFYVGLSDMGRKVGRKIELYQTDAASLQAVLRQYRQESNRPAIPAHLISPTDPHPPLFELGKTVAYNYLKRVPLLYAKEHRIMCVDHLAPNTYWFVTDGTNDEGLAAIVPGIEKSNAIKIFLIKIARSEFDELHGYYTSLQKEKGKEHLVDAEKANRVMSVTAAAKPVEVKPLVSEEPPAKPAAAAVPDPPKIAKDVIISEVQATIISGEEEKGGIAGFLQKMTQNMSANKEDAEITRKIDAEYKVPEKEKVDSLNAQVKILEPDPVVPAAAVPAVAPVTAPAADVPVPVATAPAVPAPTPVATPVEAAPAAVPAAAATTDDASSTDIGKALAKAVETLEELKEHIKKGFIPRMVAAVVSFAIHEKASDIHIEAFLDEVRIRYRIDGQLIDIVKLSPEIHSAMVSRIKILARLRLDETRVPQDGRFDVNFDSAQVDLRVSIMPTVHGEKVVMRILDKSKGIVSLEALGIFGLGYENIIKSINKPFGICLATGPTGSGKSTSLYAILNRIATPNVNVITLEDPVEYEMKGINQSQIKPKIGFTFAEGLRAVLRQDPNIIMVGEIRDGETANMATQAALTGHLVLSTLHTNDAAGAIPRLANMGIEPFLITSSLNVAIGQRLVRKICPNCRSDINMPDGIRAKIEADLEAIGRLNPVDAKRLERPFKFYQGTGCGECNGSGYKGRIGIYEVLMLSDAIEDLTLKRSSGTEIQAQAQKEGMLTMYQDGLLKVIQGTTTLDEVLRETSNK